MTEPTRFLEVELTFDVDDTTASPSWEGVPGVASVTHGEERQLDALYLDADDLALSRSGVAVRRRTGGPDEGWHIKGPLVDGARLELGWPLGDGESVPEGALAEIARWTTAPLLPLARIVNARTAYELLDAQGGVLAEFVDDRVRTTDLRSGSERAWREWEVELGPAAPADRETFFAAVARAAHSAGAREASSASKLARALGH